MKRRVLIFGTFDGFHDGHEFVIKESKKKGSELVVAVARDDHVRLLKQKEPQHSEHDRLMRVSLDLNVSRALFSDEKPGTYNILDEIQPDVIVLGFDQTALREDLKRWMRKHNRIIPIETLNYCQRKGNLTSSFVYAPHVD